jgi:curli biogenesis system outer membrane secretion channel CsgG
MKTNDLRNKLCDRLILQAVWIMVAFFGLAASQTEAQTPAAPEKKRLCVGPITANKSVAEKAAKNGQDGNLRQIIEGLDTTLVDQINASRKFELVARKSALKPLLDEQDFGASGNIDPATAAKAFKLAGAQYLVFSTITDFAMGHESVEFKGIGTAASREAVRVGCSIQVYDTTTGKLIESARFRGQEASVSREGNAIADGATLTKISDKLAADILNHIVDAIYPAKVVSKLGTQITINRGEGTGLTVGEVWSVFALGQEITDPDTGEKLGQNEAEVGKIKIVRVTPKLSYAETVEDNGVVVGNIVRPKQADAAPATEPKTDKSPKEKSVSDKIKDDM